jgi:hypothetical protein
MQNVTPNSQIVAMFEVEELEERLENCWFFCACVKADAELKCTTDYSKYPFETKCETIVTYKPC